jgi:hypothetical protein
VCGGSVPRGELNPGPGQDAPPNLGLIRSGDAGRSWDPVSLLGEADFHVLRSQGDTVYGLNGLSGALMVSRDGGRVWDEHEPPGPMLDLAVHPDEPSRVVAATEQGLVSSSDSGRGWRALAEGRSGLPRLARRRPPLPGRRHGACLHQRGRRTGLARDGLDRRPAGRLRRRPRGALRRPPRRHGEALERRRRQLERPGGALICGPYHAPVTARTGKDYGS